jgi:hypothetical protein
MDTKSGIDTIVKQMQEEIDLYKKSQAFISDKIVDELLTAIKGKLIV